MRELKAELRSQRLALRDAISPEDRIEKSLAIASFGIQGMIFKPGTIISGFLPIRSEVDLRPLMILLRQAGARLCLPAIIDRQTIVFREYFGDHALVPGVFGTSSPGPDAAELDPEILLVPLSAFDAKGHRIGYGAGHYYRAIDRLHKKALVPQLIGIAFDCQEVASVPAEPHDIGLDAMLTESGLRYFARQIG